MKPKKEKRLSDYDTSGNLGVTEMFGAIFFMIISGFKNDYNFYYQVKYQKRNIWTGYLLTILFFIGLFLFFYYVYF